MNNPERSRENSPVIKLAEDREIIARKLKEYESRLDVFLAPEQQFDTIYKIAVTQKLLENGEVNTYDLSRELAAKFGSLDTRLFENACAVIQDYIATGGKHTHGGTGLYGDEKNKFDAFDDENNNGPGRVM